MNKTIKRVLLIILAILLVVGLVVYKKRELF